MECKRADFHGFILWITADHLQASKHKTTWLSGKKETGANGKPLRNGREETFTPLFGDYGVLLHFFTESNNVEYLHSNQLKAVSSVFPVLWLQVFHSGKKKSTNRNLWNRPCDWHEFPTYRLSETVQSPAGVAPADAMAWLTCTGTVHLRWTIYGVFNLFLKKKKRCAFDRGPTTGLDPAELNIRRPRCHLRVRTAVILREQKQQQVHWNGNLPREVAVKEINWTAIESSNKGNKNKGNWRMVQVEKKFTCGAQLEVALIEVESIRPPACGLSLHRASNMFSFA